MGEIGSMLESMGIRISMGGMFQLLKYKDMLVSDMGMSEIVDIARILGIEPNLNGENRQALDQFLQTKDLGTAVDLIQSPESLNQLMSILFGSEPVLRIRDETLITTVSPDDEILIYD